MSTYELVAFLIKHLYITATLYDNIDDQFAGLSLH